MTSPEYPQTQELCEEIENASFRVKLRGYAPEEVDAFMDGIAGRLRASEKKIEEVQKYEAWLHDELHAQIVSRAQEEARQLLLEAHTKARALLEAAQVDIARKEEASRLSLQRESAQLLTQRAALERELSELRGAVESCRAQSIQTLEDGLAALRQDERGESAGSMSMPLPASVPVMSMEAPEQGSVDTMDEIDRILAEIRKQVKP